MNHTHIIKEPRPIWHNAKRNVIYHDYGRFFYLLCLVVFDEPSKAQKIAHEPPFKGGELGGFSGPVFQWVYTSDAEAALNLANALMEEEATVNPDYLVAI